MSRQLSNFICYLQVDFNLAVQEYLNGVTDAPSPDVYLLFGHQVEDITDEEQKKAVHLMVVITSSKATNLLELAKKRKMEAEQQGMDVSSVSINASTCIIIVIMLKKILNFLFQMDLASLAAGGDVCVSESDDWDRIQKALKQSPQIVPVGEMQPIAESDNSQQSLLVSDLSELRVTTEFLDHFD